MALIFERDRIDLVKIYGRYYDVFFRRTLLNIDNLHELDMYYFIQHGGLFPITPRQLSYGSKLTVRAHDMSLVKDLVKLTKKIKKFIEQDYAIRCVHMC